MPGLFAQVLALFVLSCLYASLSWAQSTVGTLFYQSNTDTGYLLMAPSISPQTWLIDNCGREINRWISDAPPALSAYLLPDGSLLRTARISNNFDAGGSGGRIDRYTWDGILTWRYQYSSDTGHQHHDIEPLPNGNILVLAWEKHTAAEAIALGRNPATVNDELWSEKIVELKPVGLNEAEYVWSWRLWDHLVQDQDPLKPNFGNPSDFPGQADINVLLFEGPDSYSDWTHANGIDYNPKLDQIVLSVKNFHELWILDHSTTKAEAATSTGGNAGRGGDMLYRWGNPQAYGRGTAADQVFYQQHDAEWVPAGRPGAGNITVFNNGKGRPEGEFATIEEIQPPLEPGGTYTLADATAFGPDEVTWLYSAEPTSSLVSKNLSGAQRQPNGNTLICAGATGKVVEVTAEGETTWQYVCPVGPGGPISQGSLASNNQLFRLQRYPIDHPAFDGKVLTPGEPVQIETDPFDCIISPVPVGLEEPPTNLVNDLHLSWGPNPFQSEFWVFYASDPIFQVEIQNATGQTVFQKNGSTQALRIDTQYWPVGYYFLSVRSQSGELTGRASLIKSNP